jgi:magnesium-dependent phosphatase 1
MKAFFFCLALIQPCSSRFVDGFPVVGVPNEDMRFVHALRSNNLEDSDSWQGDKYMPKIVIFDLDGCLWRPEMYELLHFSGGAGAPFTPSVHDTNVLLTRTGEPVYLLGNVRDVMREVYLEPQWKGVQVGISSRTDQPDWARELLKKFHVVVTVEGAAESFVLDAVFQGPIQIASDSKVKHFQRIKSATNVPFEDMLFFDNEFGNCQAVSDLGVTVGYCPEGVTNDIWKAAVEAFPARPGKIVEL